MFDVIVIISLIILGLGLFFQFKIIHSYRCSTTIMWSCFTFISSIPLLIFKIYFDIIIKSYIFYFIIFVSVVVLVSFCFVFIKYLKLNMSWGNPTGKAYALTEFIASLSIFISYYILLISIHLYSFTITNVVLFIGLAIIIPYLIFKILGFLFLVFWR